MARYAFTIFLSALLLFQVQPLIAKYILPWFGGGPSIWTTCMLFFQLLLVGGYAYAHLLSVKLNVRRQGIVHLSLVLASLALLPIAPSEQWKPTSSESPVAAILLLLLFSVGGPYFVLSSTGPLMQRWFSRSFVGRSPYRLYSLSNFGSLLALLSYPFVLEPLLRLREQVWIWSGMYVAFAISAVWCSVRVMKLEDEPDANVSTFDEMETAVDESVARPGWGRILLWLGLAAMGSAMLLATTNQMCIDVAVVPFLWVLPLSLYLLTFVICFDNPRWYDRRIFGVLLAVSAAAACWQLNQGVETSIPDLVTIHLAVMFACCMCCHGELVRSRPHPQHLTLFYLLVSAGGALGGVLVAVVSPAMFTGFWEYHLALGGACGMTLIAWYVNRDRQARFSTSFWMGTVVSAIQIAIVIEVVFRRHADAFAAGDVSLLFGVLGVIHLTGWIITANSQQHPKRLAVVWTAVTAGQLAWVIGFAAMRLGGSLSNTQYAVLALTCVVSAFGLLAERKLSEPVRRWGLLIGLQLLVVLGVAALTFEGTISHVGCSVLAGTYVGLSVITIVLSRRSPGTFSQHGAWFWAPAMTLWMFLAMELHQLVREDGSGAIHISRNFYGVLQVRLWEDDNGEYYSLAHGAIVHGSQYVDDYWRLQPTTYYGPGTGVDLALRLHPRRLAADPQARSLRVGVVGLGTGTIAAHGASGDAFRFYEINPDVAKVSNKYFTYLRDSAADTEVVLGDARVVLDRELDEVDAQRFDVLVVDAFSSDAIPIHLLTAECGDLYRKRLNDDGLLVIHISNRYLDLNPVTRALAEHLGWKAVRIDTDDDDASGVDGAEWIIITANDDFLSQSEVQISELPWDESEPAPLLWTDDFAGLWQVISW